MGIYKDALRDALTDRVFDNKIRRYVVTRKSLLSARNRYLRVNSVKELSPKEIRAIRGYLKMSTRVFADLLAVSPKTVSAWERGASVPSGPALRLMAMARKNPDILIESGAILDRTALIED